ncbi:MAG: hypothetical protein R3Y06_05125 [Faecalibacterium sp.]
MQLIALLMAPHSPFALFFALQILQCLRQCFCVVPLSAAFHAAPHALLPFASRLFLHSLFLPPFAPQSNLLIVVPMCFVERVALYARHFAFFAVGCAVYRVQNHINFGSHCAPFPCFLF